MKITKSKEHSLLIKPFGTQGRLYLSCTVLLFFDLENPADLLGEQELWKTIPQVLGQENVLDMGIPKPRGELLVIGKCFAPRGSSRPSSEVAVRVGGLQKKLHVFGNRYWQETGVGRRITDPQPFSEMPISWEKAFGGEGFVQNPLGKGIHSCSHPDGQTLIPLPNIESPLHLIGSPNDRPAPAGFSPLDIMWPQRYRKQGTYDERWLKERWPHFPDNMDYEIFNAAPEDQFLPGWFNGDETIEIRNMHPDIQLISSRLPEARIRCFLTKQKELHRDETVFEDVKTHIDTVWLFPELMRGLVVHRGTSEILDDEYADVSRIYLATEHPADPPKSLEYYAEAQRKALSLALPENAALSPKAQEKINKAMQRIRAIPREVEDAKQKAMGKSPVMPRTPAELGTMAQGLIQKGLGLCKRLEIQSREMQARFGGRAAVPLERFDQTQARLEAAGERIQQAVGVLEKARIDAGDIRKRLRDRISTSASAEDLARAGVDIEATLGKDRRDPWHERGFRFVVECRKQLEQNPATCEALKRLGFSHRTIRRAWFGVNPVEREEAKELWGLPPGTGQTKENDRMHLPAGLVVPRFQEATLSAIALFPGKAGEWASTLLVDGSDSSPLFLPAIPFEDTAPIIRVADDLQARLLEQEVGDICNIIALQNPAEQPGKEAADAIKTARTLLLILQADTPPDEWAAWLKAFPEAAKLPLPAGKTVFAARRKGTDIRQWILAALPAVPGDQEQLDEEARQKTKAAKWSPVSGLLPPPLDLKTMIAGAFSEVKTGLQPIFASAHTSRTEMDAKLRKAILDAGEDPEKLLPKTPPSPPDFVKSGEEAAQRIANSREEFRAAGTLTLQAETEMHEAEAMARQLGQESQARYEAGMSRIDQGLKKIEAARAGEIPAATRKGLQEAGLDPERMKKRTREEVISMYSRGESLAGVIVSGIDLSGLELPGIDLRQAQCKKTNFSGSNLEGADLRQTIAQEADFSGACLKYARIDKGIFTKARCKKIDLSQADLSQSIFKAADLSEANFSDARLHMTVLQKAKLHKAVFERAQADLALFSEADASDAVFSDARLRKCLFQRAVLDRANFSGAVFHSTMLYGAKGEKVIFRGADLSNCRMGGQTSFPGADFSNIRMDQGCLRDCDFSGARFQGSRFNTAMLENCLLTQTDFYRVSAQKTRFAKSNLEGADLRGMNLFQGSLRKARLVEADLRGANLFAVDFYKAVLGNTRLDGANLKMTFLFKRTEYLP